MAAPTHIWVFRARLGRVVDGDTVDLELDVGMHARRLERLRLLAVDAPEINRAATVEAGKAAKAYVEGWMADALAGAPDPAGWPFVIVTAKDPDNFGRYLAVVWRTSDDRELNADLVEAGHAVAV